MCHWSFTVTAGPPDRRFPETPNAITPSVVTIAPAMAGRLWADRNCSTMSVSSAAVTVTENEPEAEPTVAVICTDPGLFAVSDPELETVATEASDTDHETDPVTVFPDASFNVADKASWPKTATVEAGAETVTDATEPEGAGFPGSAGSELPPHPINTNSARKNGALFFPFRNRRSVIALKRKNDVLI